MKNRTSAAWTACKRWPVRRLASVIFYPMCFNGQKSGVVEFGTVCCINGDASFVRAVCTGCSCTICCLSVDHNVAVREEIHVKDWLSHTSDK